MIAGKVFDEKRETNYIVSVSCNPPIILLSLHSHSLAGQSPDLLLHPFFQCSWLFVSHFFGFFCLFAFSVLHYHYIYIILTWFMHLLSFVAKQLELYLYSMLILIWVSIGGSFKLWKSIKQLFWEVIAVKVQNTTLIWLFVTRILLTSCGIFY